MCEALGTQMNTFCPLYIICNVKFQLNAQTSDISHIFKINVIKSQMTYFVRPKSKTPGNTVFSFPFSLSPTSGEASLRSTWVDKRLD